MQYKYGAPAIFAADDKNFQKSDAVYYIYRKSSWLASFTRVRLRFPQPARFVFAQYSQPTLPLLLDHAVDLGRPRR
jgi:hypothetical protein